MCSSDLKQNKAYIEAMRVFQNDFYEKVSKKYGLAKIGPARDRVSRKIYFEQEQIAAGQQEAMRLINISMMENEKAAEFLLAKDRIAAFRALAESGSTDKMILPYDVTQMIGSTSVLGDAFFKGVSNGNSNNA